MLDEVSRIKVKDIPSEILYGVMELKESGWLVDIYDVGNDGLFGKINRFIKPYGINLISYSTVKRIQDSDIIIVKDNFSLMTTLLCRLLRKKIIYKDSMFIIPRRFWERWSAYINLRLASAVIAYSKHQARLWEKVFNLNENHIETMHYCVDTEFYPEIEHEIAIKKSYVISIGRDLGRDYNCLSKASKLNGLKIKLITLPYLLSKEIINNNNIDILERVPYSDLFELYKNSLFSVVPLSKGLNYPTGIRGVLESLVLGIPTIATRTPVLEEYFQDRENILFVDAEDESTLSSAMTELAENSELAHRIAANGKIKARSCYNMHTYTKELEAIIANTINS